MKSMVPSNEVPAQAVDTFQFLRVDTTEKEIRACDAAQIPGIINVICCAEFSKLFTRLYFNRG